MKSTGYEWYWKVGLRLPLIGGWLYGRWLKTPAGVETLRKLAEVLAAPIRGILDYEGFARKVFRVRPLDDNMEKE